MMYQILRGFLGRFNCGVRLAVCICGVDTAYRAWS